MASTSGSSGCSVPMPTAPGSPAAVPATQRLSSRAMPGLCAYEKKQKRSTPRSASVSATFEGSKGWRATHPSRAKWRWMASASRGGWRWTWTSMQGNGAAQGMAVGTALSELEAAAPDPELDDLVAHGAATVLDHREHARHAVAHALAAHHDDGVGGGADVAHGHLAGQEVPDPRLLGRHEQERGDRLVRVAVAVDERAVLQHRQADLDAYRLGVAVDRLAVQLVEHPELDGVGWLVHRLHAVHDHAPRARREVEVEERPHRVERVVVGGLPVPVELPRAVGRRHLEVAHAAHPLECVAVERVHLIGRRVRLGHRPHPVRPLLP